MCEHAPFILKTLEGVWAQVQRSQEPQEAWRCPECLKPTWGLTSDLGTSLPTWESCGALSLPSGKHGQ